MTEFNGVPFQYNPAITNVNIDNQLAGILSRFSDDYILDIVKDSINNRFRIYDLPRPNIVNAFEIIFVAIITYCMLKNIEIEKEEDNISYELFSDNNVSLYVNEIIKIPLLTNEEEKELAIEVKNGDKLARKKFIESNLRLVIKNPVNFVNGI